MLALVWSQIRHRAGRTVALLLGIAVATTSFTVLTATSRTSQLQTTSTVAQHFRAAYDILVRPRGVQSETERRAGTVQPNFLSGIYGGITDDQWKAIQKLPGVDVAAPIAMVGTVLPSTYLTAPVTPYLTASSRQLFRIHTDSVSDRGLTKISEPDSYVYVTKNSLSGLGGLQPDGAGSVETAPDGTRTRTCPGPGDSDQGYAAADPFGAAARSLTFCWSSSNDTNADQPDALSGKNPGASLPFAVPLLVAGVDPASEARLAHLDGAVVSGRYLRDDDADKLPGVPVLMSQDSGVDNSLTVTIDRLPDPAVPPAPHPVTEQPAYQAQPGTPVARLTYTAQQAYAVLLAQTAGRGGADQVLNEPQDGFWQSGPTDYSTDPAGTLVPVQRGNPPSVWQSQQNYGGARLAPMENSDQGFRVLTPHPWTDIQRTAAVLHTVGVFDPGRLPSFDPLSQVDLGVYTPVSAAPGDDASRRALAGRDLLPDANLAGHLRQPPQLITTLDGIAPFYGPAYGGPKPALDPISVIRVRVGGVLGPDAVSRERVNQVAQQIATKTGLQVDLVVGSSTAPTLVQLPAGKFGRPHLLLAEGWVKKNVAVMILQAVNRKSVVLFVLILAVCALFVANGTSAAVRTRRSELGVLACLGWSRPRLYAAILLEVLLLGALSGAVGSLIAVPLGRVLGLNVSSGRAALAVPAAVLLALSAGLVPAWRASRADPGAAVRPAVASSRAARSPSGIAGLALSNVLRNPGRSLVAAAGLAVGAAALTLLVGVTLAFRGVVVGSLLGDAVAVQVRGVDLIAVIATVALGVLAVADVLFLNVRERAAELATLRATGWTEGALSRLVVLEGTMLGLMGTLAGAAVGLAGAALFAGALPGRLLLVSVGVLCAGVAVTALAAFVPARLLRRLPTAPLLAED